MNPQERKFRYFVRLAYDGTRYHGWQSQDNAHTVQDEVEKCLSLFLGKKIQVVGCGRTDTGVHAREFFLHIDLDECLALSPDEFIFRMNCVLPKDIVFYNIFPVNPEAHARFSAISRTYVYTISLVKNPFTIPYSFHCLFQPDVDMMNQGAALLKSFTDFTSFSKIHTDTYTNNCKVSQAHWEMNGDELRFTITADRFLRNMVRAIVGTHINLGRGKISLEEYIRIIEARDRSKAGYSVPPQGLALVSVVYREGFTV